MSKGNLHTHSVLCDGNDTLEELVNYAISQKCDYIGFSGHSYTGIPEDDSYCMSRENTQKYKAEISRLKKEYKNKIKILMGIEQDYYSVEPTEDYDFVIGSVHSIIKDGHYISVDESEETQKIGVQKYYGGDYYAFAEDYYRLAGDVFNKTKCHIIGHFDLVTKYNENNKYFDTQNPRYVSVAENALNKLLRENVKFEINYGAVARGLRTTPYPEARLISKIRQAGKEIIYTSDCHKKEMLLFGIPENED